MPLFPISRFFFFLFTHFHFTALNLHSDPSPALLLCILARLSTLLWSSCGSSVGIRSFSPLLSSLFLTTIQLYLPYDLCIVSCKLCAKHSRPASIHSVRFDDTFSPLDQLRLCPKRKLLIQNLLPHSQSLDFGLFFSLSDPIYAHSQFTHGVPRNG